MTDERMPQRNNAGTKAIIRDERRCIIHAVPCGAMAHAAQAAVMIDDASPTEAPRDLFDRHRRALRRARAIGPRGDWFGEQMGAMLLDRLDDLSRSFSNVLVIGARNPALIAGLAHGKATSGAAVSVVEPSALLAAKVGAIVGAEDRLPVEPDSYDCILWPGGLESVNDVPGALLRCRLALRGDGLLLGCFVGDGSFPALRAALTTADVARPVARMGPQIDTRAMGDLLTRTGLTMGVADTERLSLSYANLDALVGDLRSGAMTNVLAGDVHRFRRSDWQTARAAFAAQAGEDGRTVEQVRFVHFSGWAPHPDQPKPARRGSATASLAAALAPGRDKG